MFSRASSYETISENRTSQWNGFICIGRASSSQPPQPRHHGILRRAICFVCTRCYGFEKKQFHSLFHGSTRWDPWSNFDAINLGDDYFWIRSENFQDSPKIWGNFCLASQLLLVLRHPRLMLWFPLEIRSLDQSCNSTPEITNIDDWLQRT